MNKIMAADDANKIPLSQFPDRYDVRAIQKQNSRQKSKVGIALAILGGGRGFSCPTQRICP